MRRAAALAAGLVLPLAASGIDLDYGNLPPTNGQEVSPDLEEFGGRIGLPWRVSPRHARAIRRAMRMNHIGDNRPPILLQISSITWVGQEVRYSRRERNIHLYPDLPLPPGQYTLLVEESAIRPPGRRHRDDYVEDFLTSFTVGPDVHPPRIRDLSPAPNQNDVPLLSLLSVTFNESVDPYSLVLGETVFVEDATVEPAIPLPGILRLRQNGFLLEFVPDPPDGLPPSSVIRVRLATGTGGPSVRDRVGNALEGTAPGGDSFSWEFWTKAAP